MFDHDTLVIFDLEFTSWEGYYESRWTLPGKHRDIVQIGAVRLDRTAGLVETAAFEILVRPRRHPELSAYFTGLTGISQAEVDRHGLDLAEAVAAFGAFCSGPSVQLCSHGEDFEILAENCRAAGISCPAPVAGAIDLSPWLGWYLGKDGERVTSADLPAALGLEAAGQRHQGLDDARAIALALRHMVRTGELAVAVEAAQAS